MVLPSPLVHGTWCSALHDRLPTMWETNLCELNPMIFVFLGLLPAVADLRVNITTTSVTISWSPPFSLIPDTCYSVFIYNVTDENNPTAILCINITETSYTFTPECFNTYNISVVPFNCVGEGESSGNITIYCELHYSVSRYSMYFSIPL